MFGWIEICVLLAATILLICAMVPQLGSYRSLFRGSSVLMLITAIFPRRGNLLGQYFFGEATGALRLPSELFGIAWWILGAWLVKSLLELVLRRTLFPDDNLPHARRLFADLVSGLIYVVAFFGIMDTVLNQPISALLATSGVFAIVLGLALQNTLSDVFSGLAINIERPFRAGDWITTADRVEGQVIEVNWRTTRIKTLFNDMIAIPNSVVAKAIVTNHSRLSDPQICSVQIKIDNSVSPTLVIDALRAAVTTGAGIASGTTPTAYACGFSDELINYEVRFAIDDYALMSTVRSDVVRRVTDTCQSRGIHIGTPAVDIRIIRQHAAAIAAAVPPNALHP